MAVLLLLLLLLLTHMRAGTRSTAAAASFRATPRCRAHGVLNKCPSTLHSPSSARLLHRVSLKTKKWFEFTAHRSTWSFLVKSVTRHSP
jgi:hypothetical protein